MRLCLMIEGQEGVSFDQWLKLAAACERGGLDGLFRSDHYLSGDGRVGLGSLDAWATLAGIAAHTSSIRLGTMVSPVTFRHPSVLANCATTVDHISAGRVELGLGAGWYETEHEAFGFPFPPIAGRMEMLTEQLEIISRQWTENEFSFAGEHYQLDRCQALPKPVQAPHPPIIIGGAGKRKSADLAARYASEYNVVSGEVDECRAVRARLDRACEKAGRDPATLPLSIMTTTVVGGDDAELHRRLDDLARISSGGLSGRELLEQNRSDWIAGTVAEARDRLAELAAVGVERAMLQHLCHTDVEMVDLIGSELVSAVSVIELPAGAIELLQQPLIAHLATLNRDGTIQVTPIWIHVEEGRPVFDTAAGRVKDRNLQRDPHCTIEVTSTVDTEHYVEIRGLAERREHDPDHAFSDELAIKYTGEPFRELEPGEVRVKWYITPLRALGPAARLRV